MGWGSAAYGQSNSESEQSQGLTPAYRNWFSAQAPGEFGRLQGFADQARQDPGGLGYRSVVDQLLPIGRYGLPTGATEGVAQLGRDLYSQYSGSRANRGFRSPDNLEAVLGDALRMASPQLIPLSTQFAMQRAQMAPALQQSAFGYGAAPFDAIRNILASTGSGTSSSNAFNFSASGGGSDRRLKTNIVRLSTHPLGIGWYEYTIFGHRQQGVMADELLKVKPEAVFIGTDGYYRVDYSQVV